MDHPAEAAVAHQPPQLDRVRGIDHNLFPLQAHEENFPPTFTRTGHGGADTVRIQQQSTRLTPV